jgi:predicted HicB family RNase H-like nuclease
MLYEANVYQMNVEDHIFWVAESKVLKGCVGQGDTSKEAISELELNEKEWLKTAEEFDIPVPPRTAKVDKKYSGKLSLRMSPYEHQKCAENAENLGISINQYINDAVINYSKRISETYSSEIPQVNNNQVAKIVEFNSSQGTNVDLEEM